MAITGTVNCQCSHVFILSCVDLYYGERSVATRLNRNDADPNLRRFANTDKALAMELKQHRPGESFKYTLRMEVDDVDEVTTYDIACEYFIHLEERFEANFLIWFPSSSGCDGVCLLSMSRATRILAPTFLGHHIWNVSDIFTVRRRNNTGLRPTN